MDAAGRGSPPHARAQSAARSAAARKRGFAISRMSNVEQANDNPMPPRLVPDRPLPPYSFVPGRYPHPVSDPAGHSYGAAPPTPTPVDPEKWAENTSFLYGLDLFNAQYYWESHVEFESLWMGCGRTGPLADFLKGLIKLAAAGVKHLDGNRQGVQSHACRAAELWRAVTPSLAAGEECVLGLRLTRLIELADSVCRNGWPEAPPVILPTLPSPPQ